MNESFPIWSLSPQWVMLPYRGESLKYTGGDRYSWPSSESPSLAIARACATLVARGFSREKLRKAA